MLNAITEILKYVSDLFYNAFCILTEFQVVRSSGSTTVTKTQKFPFSLNAWVMDFVLVTRDAMIMKRFSSGMGLIRRVWPRKAAWSWSRSQECCESERDHTCNHCRRRRLWQEKGGKEETPVIPACFWEVEGFEHGLGMRRSWSFRAGGVLIWVYQDATQGFTSERGTAVDRRQGRKGRLMRKSCPRQDDEVMVSSVSSGTADKGRGGLEKNARGQTTGSVSTRDCRDTREPTATE